MLRLYLDSSAITKRYVFEPDTPVVDTVFDQAGVGKIVISLSFWSIGEVLCVLDERLRRKWLSEDDFKEALRRFAEEFLKLIRLKAIEVVPVLTPILAEAWGLILNQHIYEADALQLSTCIHHGNDALLSGDKRLTSIAKKLGLRSLHTTDEEDVKELIKSRT